MSNKRIVNQCNRVLAAEIGMSGPRPKVQWGFSRVGVYDFGCSFRFSWKAESDEFLSYNLSMEPGSCIYFPSAPVKTMETTLEITQPCWVAGIHVNEPSQANPEGFYYPLSTTQGFLFLREGLIPDLPRTQAVIDVVRAARANARTEAEAAERKRNLANWSRPRLPDGSFDMSESVPAGSKYARQLDMINDLIPASGALPGTKGRLIYNAYDHKGTSSNDRN